MRIRTLLVLVGLGVYSVACASQAAPQRAQIDVRDFGAVCDNKTDDSTSLQKAITTGISKGHPVYIPGGGCIHKATLIMNSGHSSVRLMGTPFLSVLKYTGTETGWLWKNGDGRQFIYTPVVIGVSFLCGNLAGCAKGIEAYSLSEGVFRDIGIGQSDGVFATNWYCSGCNIMNLDHPVLSGQSKSSSAAVGLDCVGCSAFIIRSGDFFYFPTATLKFSGPTTHIVVDGNWFESQDTAILLDDSGSNAPISSDLISIVNNRFLFNGAGGAAPKQGSFSNQVALRVNNTGTKPMTVTGIIFGPGNSVFCAAGLCGSATPIVVAVSPTTAAGTEIDITVKDNTFRGVKSGVISSSSNRVGVFMQNNRTRDASGKALTTDVVGTATVQH